MDGISGPLELFLMIVAGVVVVLAVIGLFILFFIQKKPPED